MAKGFKEWAPVCGALEQGLQHVLARKGGIAEDQEGFRFAHDEFFLFPTIAHAHLARTRLPADTPVAVPIPGRITVTALARVVARAFVSDWEICRALAPFHVLLEDVLHERFHYGDAPGLHVAVVRIFKLATPWSFADDGSFGGCRSWIDLPEPPADLALVPAISDAAHAEIVGRIAGVIGTGA